MLFLFSAVLTTHAQKKKLKRPNNLSYTIPSGNYLNAAETDSLVYAATAAVFADYKVPNKIFRERYPSIKLAILQLAKKEITDSLQAIKNTVPDDFDGQKKLYTSYLKQAVVNACHTSKIIQKQLYLNASDHINFYKSHVTILPSGKLHVRETITVFNTNENSYNSGSSGDSGFGNYDIKRGIFRSFPTVYVDEYKMSHEVGLDVKQVTLDGKKEPYTLKKSDNGYYLQIGNANIFLEAGRYTYDIVYETDFQIKFLKDFDELYWNATGNGWSFRIDSALCTLQLPANASVMSNACYTGFSGEKKSQCEVLYSRIKDSLLVSFKTNRPLAPNQGLTVATSWRKGIVTPPGKQENFIRMVKSNLVVFIMSAVIILLLVFNFIAWLLVGKDPAKGNVIPQFYPPAGLSPAAAGFMQKQGFDNRLVAATIIDLAVRNKIEIDIDREGLLFKSNVYKITASSKSGTRAGYVDFESDVKDLVGSTIKKGKYNSDLGDLRTKILAHCKSTYLREGRKTGFLAMNNRYMAVGNLLTLLSVAGLLFAVIPKTVQQNPWQLLFLFGGLVICIIIQKSYYGIMKAYTGEGRKTMDIIEGFRMYLRAADEQRIDAMNPPKKTIELYEKYMPWAVALDCEIEWGKQFQDIIATAAITAATSSGISHMHRDFSDRSSFGSSFSSGLSGTISSASSPPSSSSGGGSSFGGGSSGGGGGGGGGGGW